MNTSMQREGIKNSQKKTTIAGTTVGHAAGVRLVRKGIDVVRIVVKGIGVGRIHSIKSMASAGVKVVSITDFTPLPEIGPRPRKVRRI